MKVFATEKAADAALSLSGAAGDRAAEMGHMDPAGNRKGPPPMQTVTPLWFLNMIAAIM